MADNHIGRVLAHYPHAGSFVIPPDVICSVIERINVEGLVVGFRLEMASHHSFSSRGPFEGGKREWGMAERYKGMADELLNKWPIVAAIFESLAGQSRADAVRHDQEAAKDSLDN